METKKAKVILLPSDNITNMGKPVHKLEYSEEGFDPHIVQTFEMYFITDDPVEKGDWCIMLDDFGNVFTKPQQWLGEGVLNKRKVVAAAEKLGITTDYKGRRETREDKVTYYEPLPQIPQDFIKQYCELGGIDEVEIELEIIEKYPCSPKFTIEKKIKVNKNNTIAINSVKEQKMYSRKEVIKLCESSYKTGWSSALAYHTSDFGSRVTLFDKWLKENL